MGLTEGRSERQNAIGNDELIGVTDSHCFAVRVLPGNIIGGLYGRSPVATVAAGPADLPGSGALPASAFRAGARRA
jgi:uncharacterized protein (UPF0210 family)